MILIADSGSTKTAWVLSDGGKLKRFTTQGLNPYHIPADELRAILARELLPQTGIEVSELYFYGAGCTPGKIPEIRGLFSGFFPNARIDVENDLLGACRGLCGRQAGIVCILGTGSNSCAFDGKNITDNVPPLGYILGDEGSGSALGKAFLTELLRGYIPPELDKEFIETYGLTPENIIENVYRKPMPARFLAGFAPFIAKHRHHPGLKDMVTRSFRLFMERRVTPYDTAGKRINFTGSIAVHFRDLLTETVGDMELEVGTVTQSPIEGLAAYHIGHE